MKKKLIMILVFILFLWITFIIFKSTIKKHHIEYQLNDFEIIEDYQKKPTDTYFLTIKKEKEIYTLSLEKNLKKKKKIITEIKEYKEKNVKCIIVSFKKTDEKTMACLLEKKQVSLDYLIKTNDNSFQTIQEKTKKEGISYPKSSDTKKQYNKITVYNNNIPENQIYYVWNYKGIYIANHTDTWNEVFLEEDLYDNPLTCTINDKFVLLENSSVNGIKNIYYYDYKKKRVRVAKIEKVISKDSYINGIKNDLIYITDNKLKRQYTLDVNRGKQEEIDEEETVYITYQEDKKKEMSKSDFFMENQYFEKKDSEKIVKENITYYRENNKYYKSYSKKKNPILLFELDNVKEWQVKGNEIVLLREDTIYAYDEQYGLRKILENKEFLYNYEGIYQLGEI